MHPKAHGHAYEHGARSDQTDADVPDGRHWFRVMVGQPQPVEQRADAHQRHPESVRPLRFFRYDQCHFRVWRRVRICICILRSCTRRRRLCIPALTSSNPPDSTSCWCGGPVAATAEKQRKNADAVNIQYKCIRIYRCDIMTFVFFFFFGMLFWSWKGILYMYTSPKNSIFFFYNVNWNVITTFISTIIGTCTYYYVPTYIL